MKICGVITAHSAREAAGLCSSYAGLLDAFEFRLDYAEPGQLPDCLSLLSRAGKPVIATLRPLRHGGRFRGSESDRLGILRRCSREGATYVDLENDLPDDELAAFAGATRVILSYHNFECTPAELPELARTLAKRPARLLKIATRTETLEDLVCLQRVQRELAGVPREKILIGMGACGSISRILGDRLDSEFTYVALPGLEGSAAGQLDLHVLLERYRVRSLNNATEVFGVLGWPLAHSLSPQIHNACFAALGMNRVYVPLAAPGLSGLQEVAGHFRFHGLSVTLPHKAAVATLCDDLDGSARRAGVVNTVAIQDHRWIGSNTDVEGFLRPLRARMGLAGQRAAVIGSGGAARGVASALLGEGAGVAVYSRNQSAGAALARTLDVDWHPLSEFGLRPADLVVQATSAGMSPRVDQIPCDLRTLAESNPGQACLVYELVYNPRRTRFLSQAQNLGFQTVEGLEMFLAQAALQFRTWTGVEMPMDVAMQAAVEGLEKPQ